MKRTQGGMVSLGLLGAMALGGCDSLSEPVAEGPVRVVPTDDRTATQALTEVAPISGGTLAISNANIAVVADPDRNRVSLVDLNGLRLRQHVMLSPGDEPGRVTIDDARGLAHVALRRSGEVATIDIAAGTLISRTRVCAAPRGITLDRDEDALYVACADGNLVALNAETRAESWRERIGVDLRDVVVTADRLMVTRFKSAEVIGVSKQGLTLSTSEGGDASHTRNGAEHPFEAAAAWRAVVSETGEVVMLHQRAQADLIAPGPATSSDPVAPPPSTYYGGDSLSMNCRSIVHGAVSTFDSYGRTSTSMPLPDMVLPVDVAVRGDTIAIAVAGTVDAQAPRPFMVDANGPIPTNTFGATAASSEVVLVSRSSLTTSGDTSGSSSSCGFTTRIDGGAQVTAVAFSTDGALVTQVREPAALMIRVSTGFSFGTAFGQPTRIDLGGESVADTGHDLFHKDSGSGIACASCHMEGGDDGRVWQFNEIGDRRTQVINIGLEGTAPFHWSGDIDNMHDLMSDVFVGRMGGVHQSGERLETLTHWMFGVQPPAPIREMDAAAERGHALFDSPEVGCASCHNGDKLTNNQTVAVGTGERGERFQVPSLTAIGYRAPFMHDGCAPTLRDRFTNPACDGGDDHGVVSQLTDSEIDDLVAYMETL